MTGLTRPDWPDWHSEWTARALDQLDRASLQKLAQVPFLRTAGPAQRPPPGDWQSWLFLGGRGAGKTRAGAEWIRFAVEYGGVSRFALVGPTLGDVREVMIEGPSGLRSLCYGLACSPPQFEPSRRRLVFDNGAEGFAFSAEDPDSLRGPQFEAAWCDEIAAWPRGETVWDMLQMCLRLGEKPQVVATTTPRPVALVRRLLAEPGCVTTRATTDDNARHLAPGFLETVRRLYAGTVLGRQELNGELVESQDGALWTLSKLVQARTALLPDRFDEIIIAVDPPASVGPRADACGIIAAARADQAGFGQRCFVLADATRQGLAPEDWAGRAVALARETGAGEILAESNQGGEMVRHTLQSAGSDVPVRLVRARVGKRARAMPVAALYDAGKVAHVAGLEGLEAEMLAFGTDGQAGSPDRVDALVWAVWTLMIENQSVPRLRGL